MSNPPPQPPTGISGNVSPMNILNSMSGALSNASNQLNALVNSGTFDPTNPNDVTLLQIYTENLNALLTATSNTMKSVFDSAKAVIQNIS